MEAQKEVGDTVRVRHGDETARKGTVDRVESTERGTVYWVNFPNGTEPAPEKSIRN